MLSEHFLKRRPRTTDMAGNRATDTGKDTLGDSPEAKLRAAVEAGKPDAGKPHRIQLPALALSPAAGLDRRAYGLAGCALALGLMLGAGTAAVSLSRGGDGLAETASALEAGRTESARLNGEVERLGRTLAALRETTEAARGDIRTRETTLIERVGRLEQALASGIAALGEHVEKTGRDQGARIAALTAQVEKRTAMASPTPAAAPASVAVKETPKEIKAPEPVTTGAIPDTKKAAEKPPVIENWALREVYDGTAVLEDRRRRLFEAVRGENIPGVGRVESIEKQGREWVVVTRAGVITPQAW